VDGWRDACDDGDRGGTDGMGDSSLMDLIGGLWWWVPVLPWSWTGQVRPCREKGSGIDDNKRTRSHENRVGTMEDRW
jgi:hypothetical protein